MKKLFYLFALTILAAGNFACKKDSASGNDSYIKFKKDGVWVTYPAMGEYGPDLGDASFTDMVIASQNTGSENIDIAIQKKGSSIPTGTYDSDLATSGQSVSMNYNVGLNFYSIEDNLTDHSRYYITITSITATTITGTFTGNFLYDYTEEASANITEGEFKVTRIR